MISPEYQLKEHKRNLIASLLGAAFFAWFACSAYGEDFGVCIMLICLGLASAAFEIKSIMQYKKVDTNN